MADPLDFPAAHSMDSTWFAVDADGHVALFETGEGGAIPTSGDFPYGGEAGGDDPFEIDLLAAPLLLAWAARRPELRSRLPEDDAAALAVLQDGFWQSWDDNGRLLAALGLFSFVCEDYDAGPYDRESEVPEAITVAQLPAVLQARLKTACLPVRFAEVRQLAPGEYGPVEAWTPHWVDTKGGVHPCREGEAVDPDVVARVQEAREREASPAPLQQPMTEAEVAALFEDIVQAGLESPSGISGAGAPPQPSGLLGWARRLFRGDT